jgi:hypothetical protein
MSNSSNRQEATSHRQTDEMGSHKAASAMHHAVTVHRRSMGDDLGDGAASIPPLRPEVSADPVAPQVGLDSEFHVEAGQSGLGHAGCIVEPGEVLVDFAQN